ncbi:hypothetical protein BSPLISOX_2586 [uncultured Gammaproteobacteria bacterium]|nr:hypothetical protein [uncultured Gammaproteobacteria bacterium]VVH65637.1 hypothetical protein BSPLISOX_2586 [uncultured Gammaproteobacteria bacterium]
MQFYCYFYCFQSVFLSISVNTGVYLNCVSIQANCELFDGVSGDLSYLLLRE